jgi:hypothetical protein
LSSCSLAALLCASSGAQGADPPIGSSAGTLPAWWGRPGSPGWVSDAALAGGLPSHFAGLVAGGFGLRDPLGPAMLPWPGVAEAQAPLAWYDSVAVIVGEGAAWRGFGSAIVSAEGVLAPPSGRRPRSVWTAVSGSSGIDGNGIFVSRGDTRSWLRGGAVAAKRGGIGDLDIAGNHLWTFGGGARRGAHVVEGAFAQRGSAERQRDGLGESARGGSGWGQWRWNDSTRAVSLRLSRGQDSRESYGVGGVSAAYSRRDAQSNVAELEATMRRGGREWGARVEVRESFAARWTGSVANRDAWRERAVWGAARHTRTLGPGRLELQLGGGRDDAPQRSRERLQLAPGMTWRLGSGPRSLRVFGERAVDPVWSDLAPGTPAFVQDSWIGGIDLRAAGTNTHALAQVVVGTTGQRATMLRYPIRDATLGIGWQREGSRYAFTLGSAEAGARWRALMAEASGYLLARGGDEGQARVDPTSGASASLTAAFRLFTGDLGVRLRGEAAWIGPRFTDARDPFFEDTTLPGFSTLSAVAELTLGDAVFALHGDNLENVRHDETWVNPVASPTGASVLARDAGRSVRFELVWPLFN